MHRYGSVGLVCILLVLCMGAQSVVAASPAAGLIGVAVNGEIIDLPRAVRNDGGTLYVPARSVLEAAGVIVHYDGQQTTLAHGPMKLVVDRSGQISEGDRIFELSAYLNGTLFIPLRLVIEALGFDVEWLASEAVAHVITDHDLVVDTLAVRGVPIIEVTEEDIELMARMVEAETFSEPYEGKVAVAAVIINRVMSSGFPNTVQEVIFQPGQFATRSHLFGNKPRQIAIQAVHDALSGWDPSLGAIYFFNPYISSNAFLFSRPVTVNIANHRFAR